jgi:hypothetical protein
MICRGWKKPGINPDWTRPGRSIRKWTKRNQCDSKKQAVLWLEYRTRILSASIFFNFSSSVLGDKTESGGGRGGGRLATGMGRAGGGKARNAGAAFDDVAMVLFFLRLN